MLLFHHSILNLKARIFWVWSCREDQETATFFEGTFCKESLYLNVIVLFAICFVSIYYLESNDNHKQIINYII